MHGHGKWRPSAKPWFMASSCSKRLTPMRICSCPNQHQNRSKKCCRLNPAEQRCVTRTKNNGPRGCEGMVQSATLCERTWVPRTKMPTWFLNRSFFFWIVLFLELCVCDDHGLSHMNEGNSAPTIQLLLKQRFTIPSLCKFPRIESKHRGVVSHMATGGVCDDLSK